MVHPNPPSMFERLFGRRDSRPRAPEPADMGTAFGMEQTLDQPDYPDKVGVRNVSRRWLPGRRSAGATR